MIHHHLYIFFRCLLNSYRAMLRISTKSKFIYIYLYKSFSHFFSTSMCDSFTSFYGRFFLFQIRAQIHSILPCVIFSHKHIFVAKFSLAFFLHFSFSYFRESWQRCQNAKEQQQPLDEKYIFFINRFELLCESFGKCSHLIRCVRFGFYIYDVWVAWRC